MAVHCHNTYGQALANILASLEVSSFYVISFIVQIRTSQKLLLALHRSLCCCMLAGFTDISSQESQVKIKDVLPCSLLALVYGQSLDIAPVN